MDVRTDRESDAVTVISALLLCLIKSYFDIWNSASRASLTTLKKSTSCSCFHDTIRYWDEILGPIVRPYAGAVGPGFLLVHDKSTMPGLMWREYAGSSWRMKELIPLNGPHARLTLIQ